MHFPQLDALVKSEIPVGNNILLLGPPGAGKTALCDTLVCESLKRGVKCLYITMNSDPEHIRKKLGASRGEVKGLLEFVDCYSWLIGSSTERFHVSNLSNLSDLSVRIISAATQLGEKIFFIIDSISTLLIYNSENEVLRFLEINRARMKRSDNVGIYVVSEGIHTEAFYNSLRQMADVVLEMRIAGSEKMERLIRMHTFKGMNHNTEWVTFEVNSDGKVAIG